MALQTRGERGHGQHGNDQKRNGGEPVDAGQQHDPAPHVAGGAPEIRPVQFLVASLRAFHDAEQRLQENEPAKHGRTGEDNILIGGKNHGRTRWRQEQMRECRKRPFPASRPARVSSKSAVVK